MLLLSEFTNNHEILSLLFVVGWGEMGGALRYFFFTLCREGGQLDFNGNSIQTQSKNMKILSFITIIELFYQNFKLFEL